MIFDRYPVRRGQRERTPRRVARAAQVVRREADAVPLFPELARWKSPSERLDAMDTESAARIQHWRDFQARSWRRARAELKTLRPLQRAGVLAYWRARIVPAQAGFLLGLIHETTRRHRCFWRSLGNLRRLRLYAMGRGPIPPMD
jgi:predicted DCC family thiol-disulfide oxidoreductase YuxK